MHLTACLSAITAVLTMSLPTALANDHRLSRDCSMYHDGAKRCSYYRGEVQICEGGNWKFWEDCEGSWYCGDYDELGINVTCIPNEYYWGEHGLKPVVEPYQ